MKTILLALAAGLIATGPAAAQTKPAATAPATSADQTKASPPGIRAIGVGAVTTAFYTVSPTDILATRLINLDVYNLQNENIGEIEDLVIDNGKRLQAVVVSVGGFLGLGERYVAVKPGSLVITPEADGTGIKALVNTTREQLRGAPIFKFEGATARSRR